MGWGGVRRGICIQCGVGRRHPQRGERFDCRAVAEMDRDYSHEECEYNHTSSDERYHGWHVYWICNTGKDKKQLVISVAADFQLLSMLSCVGWAEDGPRNMAMYLLNVSSPILVVPHGSPRAIPPVADSSGLSFIH